MNQLLLSQLNWLKSPPGDFRAKCKEVINQDKDWGSAIVKLATLRLSGDQLVILSKVLKTCQSEGRDLKPLLSIKLGVLGNGTVSGYTSCLPAAAARHGINLQVIESDYDQYVQDALDAKSVINNSQVDFVLLALDYRAFPINDIQLGDPEAERLAIDRCMQHLLAIRDGLSKYAGAPVIFQTLVPTSGALFGNIDSVVFGTPRSIILALNDRIRKFVSSGTDYLFDTAALAEHVGLEAWHDPAQWNLYKLPFAQNLVPLYAEYVGRLLSAIKGKSRKCLVLDLDNTLWGGVIGDDGLDGIVLGQGNAVGEAFLDVQRTALLLRQRGIVLAVCTKNDESVARQPFVKHPEMLIKEEHIAVFQANWSDKATNLEAIASALNIGLESLVLLDDNPFERQQVREALPMVAVPELPTDPAYYASTLLSAGYFESIAFTHEDQLRAEQYQSSVKRAEFLANGRDISGYLASLNMEISCTPFDDIGRSRITQLINKTNQFNLTTQRVTEADVLKMQLASEAFFTMQVRVKDIFGDQGVVSIVCARILGHVWEIDIWLMSCRVLGRKVENFVFDEILLNARAKGALELIGRYIPSSKNSMVADHYKNFGFTLLDTEASGLERWSLTL